MSKAFDPRRRPRSRHPPQWFHQGLSENERRSISCVHADRCC
jgi:hypothetical protein